MSNVKHEDLLKVNRGGVDYQISAANMSKLLPTDLLLINRNGADYRCTVEDFLNYEPSPAELQPIPDGVEWTEGTKQMVINKVDGGAGTRNHAPWIKIDVRTGINTDDYLFCMCQPLLSGTGGSSVNTLSHGWSRESAIVGYNITHPEAEPYEIYSTGGINIYHGDYTCQLTQWVPFEALGTPFNFHWSIGNHISMVGMKDESICTCQPYIVAYPKSLITFTSHSNATELNGGEEVTEGANANVPEGSYFLYFYGDRQYHYLARDGVWQRGKSFKDSKEWTASRHEEMLASAPMLVDIGDWNFKRVEK